MAAAEQPVLVSPASFRQFPPAADRGGGKEVSGAVRPGGFGGEKYSGGAEFAPGGAYYEELMKPAATPCGGRMGCICLRTVTTARKFAGMWC